MGSVTIGSRPAPSGAPQQPPEPDAQADVALKAKKQALTQESNEGALQKDKLTDASGKGKLEQKLFAADAIAKLSPEQALALLSSSPLGVQLQDAPLGQVSEAAKLFTALADRLDASKVPDPSVAGSSFQFDVPDFALPAVGALPVELSALPAALRVLETLTNSRPLRPEQQKRIEIIKAYTRVLEADFNKQQLLTQAIDGSRLVVSKQMEAAQKVVAASFKSFMDPLRNGLSVSSGGTDWRERVADINNDIPVIPPDDVCKMEDAIKSVRTEQGAGAQGASVVTAVTGTQSHAFNTYLENGDVDALMILVMMQCTNTEESLLRDQMKDMQAANAKKKALREVKTKMKAESARLESQMREEFNTLKANGSIHSSIDFDAYKGWRQCQWADVQEDGSGNMSWPNAQLEQPIPPLPQWMIGGIDKTNDAAAPAQKAPAGDEFGLPPAVMKILQKLFDKLPVNEKGDYASFEDWMSTQGFLPVQYVPDDVKANLSRAKEIIDEYRTATESAGPTKVLNIDDLKNKDSFIYGVVQDVVMLRALAAANGGSGPAADLLASKEAVLQKILSTATPAPQPPDNLDYASEFADMVAQITTDVKGMLTQIKTQMDWMSQNPVATYVAGSAMGTATGDLPVWSGMDDAIDSVNGATGGYSPAEVMFQGNGELLDFLTGGLFSEIFEADDVEDAFPGGHFGTTSQGTSQETSNTFGPNGFGFSGSWSETDDDDDSGSFSVGFPAPTTEPFPSLCELMGQAGNQGFTSATMGAAIGAVGAVGMEALSGEGPFAITGPVAGTTDSEGNELLNEEDLAKMEDKINKAESDLDDPKSSYARWIKAHDYDGSQAEAEAEANADKPQKNKDEKPTGAEGIGLDFSGGLDELSAFAQSVDDKLQSISEQSEIDGMRMQMMMDRRSKFIETLSNLIKKIDQTMDVISGNMK